MAYMSASTTNRMDEDQIEVDTGKVTIVSHTPDFFTCHSAVLALLHRLGKRATDRTVKKYFIQGSQLTTYPSLPLTLHPSLWYMSE
jgi:hypothetical protein